MSLLDKVAIVTGAGSGIGAAIAVKFAAEGAKVAIVDIIETRLTVVSKEVAAYGSGPLSIVADVTKDDDVQRIVNETKTHFGKIDILINNAGIYKESRIIDSESLKIFDEIINVNLRAMVYLTHLAAPHIIETKGNIINTSSVAAFCVKSDKSFAYNTSKAALSHFTRCVALELAEKGVRVNCINPGPVATNIGINCEADRKLMKEVAEWVKNSSALNKTADSEEIADLAAFVASNRGRSITGSCLVIDNGYLLK